MQPRDVVLVMLYRIEWHGIRQIRQACMDAVKLVDRHLVLFELEVGDALLQAAHENVMRELVLIGEAVGWNRPKPRQKALVDLLAPERCSH